MPDDVTFQTKPQLARALLARALDAGVPPPWVTADAVYGADSHLRRMLEGRGQCYVLAVASNVKPSTWPPYAHQDRWPWPTSPRRSARTGGGA